VLLGDKQSRDRGNYKKTDKTLKTPRKLGKIKRKPSQSLSKNTSFGISLRPHCAKYISSASALPALLCHLLRLLPLALSPFSSITSRFSLCSPLPPACVLRTLPAATSTALPPAGGTLATILCTPECIVPNFDYPVFFVFFFLGRLPIQHVCTCLLAALR